jgi:hypothetical protein
MAVFALGLFIGGLIGAAIIAVISSGAEGERVPLADHTAAIEAAKTEAFRQGRIMQALTQSEKDSARAKKAAQTRRAQLTAPDRRGAP